PQNIQSVSAFALSQQQVISMSDGVIRNVSGAMRLEHWGDMYTNIVMRGSQIQAFRNGFNVVSSFWGPLTEDISMVDHIEFVKGPAGFMVSNGESAGLYNVVTKKPTGQTQGAINFTTGSYGLYRVDLDLDGKLSKDGKLLYRLNLAGQNKGSHRAYEFNNRYTIAPVISYQVNDKSKLTLEYTLQKAKMSDVGSFYVFSTKGYASLPVDFTTYNPGLAPTNINDHSLFINFTHQLNDKWQLTTQAAYFNSKQIGSSMWPDSVSNHDMIRGVGIWDAKSEMTLAQAFLNGTAYTGKVRHRILGGIDMGSKDYMADWAQTHSLDSANGGEFVFDQPNYGYPVNGYPNFDRTTNLEARSVAAGGIINQRYSSIYAQDELGFLDNRIRLTLAGRYTYISQAEWGEAAIVGKKFTPRIGLSVTAADGLALYGLYDQTFIPQAAGRLIDGGRVKPITGSTLEFGIKKEWAEGRWNTSLTAYRMLRNDEAQASSESTPNNPLSFLLGQRRTRGIEFDLRGELMPGLTLTANYALTDSRVSKVGNNVPEDQNITVGDRVPSYAKHTVNAWLTYKLQSGPLKGTGVQGGFSLLTDRISDSWGYSKIKLANYYKFDGGLFWGNNKLTVTANVFNVFNKYLYSGSAYSMGETGYTAYYWQTESPRAYRLSLGYKF
ncbi:MAG: TonB-dependent receptor, partial [Sphingobacteriaceae bacterium]